MNIEMPVFSGGAGEARITAIEKWLYYLAEQIASAPFEISGFERRSVGSGSDEIELTYPDGSKVRYTLSKTERA